MTLKYIKLEIVPLNDFEIECLISNWNVILSFPFKKIAKRMLKDKDKDKVREVR